MTPRPLPVAALLLLAASLPAQPSNVLVWGDPADSIATAWSESRAILQSASGDLYVVLRRGGSMREVVIWRSQDLGAT